jgi:copper chaperone NosL
MPRPRRSGPAVLRLVAIAALAAAPACGAGLPPPAGWVSGAYQCQFCRMTVVDRTFASQIAVPHDEARFFDDLGCLANYLAKMPAIPPGAALYVADHRTGDWVAAAEAVFTRVPTLTAPMGSHHVAHASEASRAADPAAAGGTPLALEEAVPGAWTEGRP